MVEKAFCRLLIVLMAAGLLYVILVPGIRTSGAFWPLIAALTIGIASNLLYLRLRGHRMLGFLARHRMIRTLVLFGSLCLPQLLVAFFESFNYDAHRHPVFEKAVSLMAQSDIAKRDLGAPILVGWSTTGIFGENKDRGNFDLEVPVQGSQGKGKLRVVGTKTHGLWKINKLILKLQDGGTIENLLPDGQELPVYSQ